jgi:hypothetical protein
MGEQPFRTSRLTQQPEVRPIWLSELSSHSLPICIIETLSWSTIFVLHVLCRQQPNSATAWARTYQVDVTSVWPSSLDTQHNWFVGTGGFLLCYQTDLSLFARDIPAAGLFRMCQRSGQSTRSWISLRSQVAHLSVKIHNIQYPFRTAFYPVGVEGTPTWSHCLVLL